MRIGTVAAPDTVDLDRVDLFDPEFFATGDPHTVWAAMRARAPLHRQVLPDGRAFWSVTRYDDACRVLGNHREFTSERGSLLNQLGRGDAAAGRMLVSTDPHRHTLLRRPLNRVLTGTGLARSRQRIRAAASRVLDDVRDGEAWDLAERAAELPMSVAAALMDLPASDWPDLIRWTGMAAAPTDPYLRVGGAEATLAIAHHQLFGYFANQVRARDGTDGDDLIRYLMTMRAGDRPLTREEIIFNCYSLLLGANATTPHTVTGTVLALVEQADRCRRVDGTPAALPGLVEEGLRWTSAASSFLRHAVDDVELSGGTVRRGEAVAVWVGSANRDERVFTEPYRFDPARRDNRHIAFGFGPHYCLGAAVARMTLLTFFDELLRRFDAIELAGEPEHLRSNFIAGFTRMPVRTTARGEAVPA